MPKEIGMLIILIPLEAYIGWLVYRGFRTGVVYMGNRIGGSYRFIERRKKPVLYWLGMSAYLIGMPTGVWVFWSALKL